MVAAAWAAAAVEAEVSEAEVPEPEVPEPEVGEMEGAATAAQAMSQRPTGSPNRFGPRC